MYAKTIWIDGQAPAISAENLNKLEVGVETVATQLDDVLNGTTVVPKAASAVTAESLVGGIPVGVPIGAISMFAGNIIPDNWLECNGAVKSRTEFLSLYNVIGTIYGAGDGSTTFNIPDMRGYFPRGWDHSRGIDTGRTLGSVQTDEIKSHTHGYTITRAFDAGGIVPPYIGGGQNSFNTDTTGQIKNTGGVETRPKNIALMFIIKYKD